MLASIIWVGLMVTLGATFGDDIADFVDRFSLVLSLLVVLGLALWFWRRRRNAVGDNEHTPVV